MVQAYAIHLEEQPEPAVVDAIRAGLRAFNRHYAPDDDLRRLAVVVRRADGTPAGGLLAVTYWGWLHVDVLWLDEKARGQGLSGRLLALAEEEARRRGCRHAHLDTMSFQALSFYERHGYQVFGTLAGFPSGHSRYFLQKDL